MEKERKQEIETGNRKRGGMRKEERRKKEGVSHPREVRGKSTGKAREGQKGAPWIQRGEEKICIKCKKQHKEVLSSSHLQTQNF